MPGRSGCLLWYQRRQRLVAAVLILVGLGTAGAGAAELMVCYATPNTDSQGPVFIQEPLRCASANKNEERGSFVDFPRGLAELYDKGWHLIQVLERVSNGRPDYVAYVEKR